LPFVAVEKAEILTSLGKRIKEVRVAKGLSHVQLAIDAGIAVSQVWKIETGKINLSVTTLYSLADALGVSVEELITIK
jgi:transcriptional regulator with XRE-family HTH domain